MKIFNELVGFLSKIVEGTVAVIVVALTFIFTLAFFCIIFIIGTCWIWIPLLIIYLLGNGIISCVAN